MNANTVLTGAAAAENFKICGIICSILLIEGFC